MCRWKDPEEKNTRGCRKEERMAEVIPYKGEGAGCQEQGEMLHRSGNTSFLVKGGCTGHEYG